MACPNEKGLGAGSTRANVLLVVVFLLVVIVTNNQEICLFSSNA